MDYFDSTITPEEQTAECQAGETFGSVPDETGDALAGQAAENPSEDVVQPDDSDEKKADEEGHNEPPAANAPEQDKPRRRTRKKKEDIPDSSEDAPTPDGDATGDDLSPTDGDAEGGLEDGGDEDGPVPESTEPGDVEENAPRRRAVRRPALLDSAGNVVYDRTDIGQHDLSVLTAAHNARRVLTATVDAIETDGEALPRVVFYQGTVKVMIPFSQMGFDLDPETVSQREARLLIDSMLGAKIDYMVLGVDTEARIAAASRRAAMLMRQRTILNARSSRDPNEYRINEGMRVMARIVHVSRNAVRVEVYGFESYVRIDNISNLWVNDIREVVQVGEERPVGIVSLQRDEFGRVTSMRVSMKAAENAPQLQLRAGNTYTGHISNLSEKAYYVRVVGIPVEVRCPIRSNRSMELMGPGDYVKFYVRAIYDGVPTGAILKVLKKKTTPGL